MLNKNILFIAPEFFNYENVIISKLINCGFNVKYLRDRPFKSSILKVISKFFPFLIYKIVERNYIKIIKGNNFDYIFVINGQTISKNFYNYLSKNNPNSFRVLYLWDSINNRKRSLDNRNFFNEIFSFDKKDCIDFDLKFRPLFYSYSIQDSYTICYDSIFIGTIHSDRFKILNNIFQQLEGLNNFKYFYIQSKFVYFFRKIFFKDFRRTRIENFKFTKLSYDNVISLLGSSNIILDVEHPLQSGLTIRTIEAFGLSKKIITTNKNIVNYNLYDENNILVIDRYNVKIPISFIKSSYRKPNNDILNYYSIDYWLDEVLLSFCK